MIKSIKDEKPDSIFITGDLIDRRRYDEEKALMLIKKIKSIAPNQGFFPSYYRGIYNDGNTYMIVSRGLGNSLAPIRLFNPPELVVVEVEVVEVEVEVEGTVN